MHCAAAAAAAWPPVLVSRPRRARGWSRSGHKQAQGVKARRALSNRARTAWSPPPPPSRPQSRPRPPRWPPARARAPRSPPRPPRARLPRTAPGGRRRRCPTLRPTLLPPTVILTYPGPTPCKARWSQRWSRAAGHRPRAGRGLPSVNGNRLGSGHGVGHRERDWPRSRATAWQEAPERRSPCWKGDVGEGREPGAGAAPSNRVTAWRFSPGDSAPIMRYEVTCARARILRSYCGGATIKSTWSTASTHQGVRTIWHEAQAVASTISTACIHPRRGDEVGTRHGRAAGPSRIGLGSGSGLRAKRKAERAPARPPPARCLGRRRRPRPRRQAGRRPARPARARRPRAPRWAGCRPRPGPGRSCSGAPTRTRCPTACPRLRARGHRVGLGLFPPPGRCTDVRQGVRAGVCGLPAAATRRRLARRATGILKCGTRGGVPAARAVRGRPGLPPCRHTRGAPPLRGVRRAAKPSRHATETAACSSSRSTCAAALRSTR